MAAVILEELVLKDIPRFIALFVEIVLNISKPYGKVFGSICNRPVDFDMEVG